MHGSICTCAPASAPHRPNLSWLTRNFAIGGRIRDDRIAHLAETSRVGAVVDLRRESHDDEEHLARHGIRFLHLPTDDHGALALRAIEHGVMFARETSARGERLLVHCEHGIGRSATLALCILVDRGAEPLDALALCKDRRPVFSPSPAQYESWCTWLRMAARPAPVAIPDFDAFKAIAYRHLRTG